MIYKIILFKNKVIYANTLKDVSSKINEEIISQRINSFPVSPFIVANWLSRKIPLKSKKRYDWIEIEKKPNSKTLKINT